MRIYGKKVIVDSAPIDHGDGSHTAGVGHIVNFVFEPLTNQNFRFWSEYAAAIKACAARSKHGKELETAVKGFFNGLELVGTPNAFSAVAYAIIDPTTALADDLKKAVHVQMCLTVTGSPQRDFPFVTHMGIFRSPLPSLKLADLPPYFRGIELGESKTLEEFYRGKTRGGISIALHSFAAQAFARCCVSNPPSLMITAPMDHMRDILANVGAVRATKLPSPGGVTTVGLNAGELRYCVHGVGNSDLALAYDGKKVSLARKDCGWLFALAFNPSHKYSASFTDLVALRDLHNDMDIAVPQMAKVVS